MVGLSQQWEVGHLLICPHCETILAVKETVPLQLDWAFEEPLAEENGRLSPPPIYNPHWHFEVDG